MGGAIGRARRFGSQSRNCMPVGLATVVAGGNREMVIKLGKGFDHGAAQREKVSLPGRWRWWRLLDFLRALNQRDCACNIDPPASSYAIMRRAGPYRGENSGPGKDDRGELDTETRN